MCGQVPDPAGSERLGPERTLLQRSVRSELLLGYKTQYTRHCPGGKAPDIIRCTGGELLFA